MGFFDSVKHFFSINDIDYVEHDHSDIGIGKTLYFTDPKAGYTTRVITEDMTVKDVVDTVRDAREKNYPE